MLTAVGIRRLVIPEVVLPVGHRWVWAVTRWGNLVARRGAVGPVAVGAALVLGRLDKAVQVAAVCVPQPAFLQTRYSPR